MTHSFPSRRALLTSACTLVIGALLAGCGGDPVDPGKPTPDPAPTCPTATPPEPTSLTGQLAKALALSGANLFYLGEETYNGQPARGVGVVPVDGGVGKLVSGDASHASSIAADGDTWYYASGSLIVRGTIAGGLMESIVYTSMGYDVDQLVLDSTSYYVTLSNSTTSASAILRGPKAGGPASIIVKIPSSSPYPGVLRVDGESLYFVTFDGAASNSVATLWKAPVAGGEPMDLVHGIDFAREIAVDDTSVYYFTSVGKTDSLMKIAKEGGTPVELLAGLNLAHGLAVNSDAVYVTEINPPPDSNDSDGNSKIHRVLKSGDCATVLATKQTLTRYTDQSLVANETSVFWGTPEGVRKAPR